MSKNCNTNRSIQEPIAKIQWLCSSPQKHLIQIAFEYSHWDRVWLLLKQGAPFPNGLNINLIPKQQYELLDFIRISQQYTEFIKNNALDEIKKAIDAQKITKTFRSLDNQSAVLIAFHSQSYEVYVLLKSKGFSLLANEVLPEINKLPLDAQFRIKRAMMLIVKEIKLCTQNINALTTK